MNRLYHLFRISFKNTHVHLGEVIGPCLIYGVRIMIILSLYAFLKEHATWFGAFFENVSFEGACWALIATQAVAVSKPRWISHEIQEDIRTGKAGILMMFPVGYVTQKIVAHMTTMFSYISYTLWLGIAIGLLVIGNFPRDPLVFMGFLLLVFGGSIVSFMGYLCMSLLGFFLEDAVALRWIYSKFDMVFWGNIVPVAVLPIGLATAALYTPFYHSGYTAGLILAKFDSVTFFSYLWAELAWIAWLFLLAQAIYLIACRKLVTNGG